MYLGFVSSVRENQTHMRKVLWLAVLCTFVSSLPDLAEAAPKVTLSPRVIKEGQTVNVSASGFTPNGHVLAHLARPDGSEYPEMQFIAARASG